MGLKDTVSDSRSGIDRTDFIDGLVIGLVIGEGSFHIGISRQDERDVPFYSYAEFKLNMGYYDSDIVRYLEEYLGVGNVNDMERKKDTESNITRYKCTNIKDIQNIIIPFFDSVFSEVPVRTDKMDSYRIWKVVAEKKRDGRSVSKEYLVKHTLMSAYAKDKVNQKSHGHSHVSYEEVRESLYNNYPRVVENNEDDIIEMVDEVVR